jgi:hypothetical protein
MTVHQNTNPGSMVPGNVLPLGRNVVRSLGTRKIRAWAHYIPAFFFGLVFALYGVTKKVGIFLLEIRKKMLNYKNGKILKPENYYLRNEVKFGPRSRPMFSGQFSFFLFCFKQQGSLGAFKIFLQQRKQEAKGKNTLLKIHT